MLPKESNYVPSDDPLIIQMAKITSPERNDALISECAHGAVHDTGVWLIQTSLFDHLRLVLDQELDTLDGGSCGLGHCSSDTGEHEVLEER